MDGVLWADVEPSNEECCDKIVTGCYLGTDYKDIPCPWMFWITHNEHRRRIGSTSVVLTALPRSSCPQSRSILANTKHLYNICTTLDQRRRRWADVVQMLYKCFVSAGILAYGHDELSFQSDTNDGPAETIVGGSHDHLSHVHIQPDWSLFKTYYLYICQSIFYTEVTSILRATITYVRCLRDTRRGSHVYQRNPLFQQNIIHNLFCLF